MINNDEVIGNVLEGMIKFDQDLTNNLMAQAWQAAEEWATRYDELIRAVEKVNDSIRVDRIISRGYWSAGSEADHYREMRERFEG